MQTPPVYRDVIDFLQKNRMTSLSTISAKSGYPDVALVYYVFDGGEIYFASAGNSGKIHNIKSNNKVGLMIGTEVDPMLIQIEGLAEIVTDSEWKMKMLLQLSNIANQNPESMNMPPLVKLLKGSDLVIVKVSVENYKFSDFSQVELAVQTGTKDDLLR